MVVLLYSIEEGRVNSGEGFIEIVLNIMKEGEEVERMARMVVAGCTDDMMKKVWL